MRRGLRAHGYLTALALLLGACGAELPVSLVKAEPDACDYHFVAERRFDPLVSLLHAELQGGADPIATVLRYEAEMAAA